MTQTDDNQATWRADVNPCWREIGVKGDGSCETLRSVVHCRNCTVFSQAGQRLFEREPSAEDLAEQTAQLAEELTGEPSGLVALIVFRIGDDWLALDVAAVVEVAEPRTIHQIPYRSNELLLGLINLRGELQLCVSLRALLGLNTAEAKQPVGTQQELSKLIVCERDGERWAFAVDEVAAVRRVSLEQLSKVPSTVSRGPRRLTEAVFTWQEHRIGRLNTDQLFKCLGKSIR